MGINESKLRRIIREEIESLVEAPMGDALQIIKQICDDELMNKSLVMKGLSFNVMQSIVDELNRMIGDERVELSAYRYLKLPPHNDAVDTLEWISEFCRSGMRRASNDLHARVMYVRLISEALGRIKPFSVRFDDEGLPKPHPGGALGARIDDDEDFR